MIIFVTAGGKPSLVAVTYDEEVEDSDEVDVDGGGDEVDADGGGDETDDGVGDDGEVCDGEAVDVGVVADVGDVGVDVDDGDGDGASLRVILSTRAGSVPRSFEA